MQRIYIFMLMTIFYSSGWAISTSTIVFSSLMVEKEQPVPKEVEDELQALCDTVEQALDNLSHEVEHEAGCLSCQSHEQAIEEARKKIEGCAKKTRKKINRATLPAKINT